MLKDPPVQVFAGRDRGIVSACVCNIPFGIMSQMSNVYFVFVFELLYYHLRCGVSP